jgi:hypothetical protein
LRSTQRRCLTFWHWSSVTPYTSSCEFAGSCVFDKQSPGILSLRPQRLLAELGQALFRSYGHFFAEFLGDLSLVRLRLLALITCVGLRYGSHISNLRGFSWETLREDSSVRRQTSHTCTELRIKASFPDFPGKRSSHARLQSNKEPPLVFSVTPSKYTGVTEY